MGFGDDPFGVTPFGFGELALPGAVTWTLRERLLDLSPATVYSDWRGTLVERHNLPDTLQITGQTARLRGLLGAGSGITLETDEGVRFSGPMTQYTKSGDGTCTVTYASDLIWLWDRICYPNPALPWQSQDRDYDARTGPAETVLLQFVNANLGPGALAARRVLPLVLPTSLGRGVAVTVTARFDSVGQLVRDIAEAAGLRVVVRQDGLDLALTLEQPQDLSAWARYGTAAEGGPGVLSPDWKLTVLAPTLTRAMVAGGGEGVARVLRERAAAGAESLWGRRTEVFVDQRQTLVPAELDKAGDDTLVEGSNPVQINSQIPDVDGMRLITDVPIGSRVGLDLDGDFITDRLRQVTTEIAPGGVVRSGVVGSPDAGLTRDQKQFLKLRKDLRKVQAR